MKKTVLVWGAMVLSVMALTACGGSDTGKTAAQTSVQTSAQTSEAQASEVQASDAQTSEVQTSKTQADTAATQAKVADGKKETVTIAAAASLETCLRDELIPLFEKSYPDITIEGTYDSSGKLQTQIEEGADVDVFFSAATKQMNALKDEGMIADGSVVELLENKIVFIVPTGDEKNYTSFEDIQKAETVAIGDPESVPVGQYSKEALESLGLWDEILAKASLGTNVTEVLNWVAEGSAKAGIVYATDAAQTDKVTVVAEAPEGSVKKAIYPVGIIKDCEHPDGAAQFVAFLQTKEAMDIFVKNGFAAK